MKNFRKIFLAFAFLFAIFALTACEGTEGIQGPAGPQGVQGPAGPTGPQGPSGPTGPQGMTGPQGPMGPEGRPGADGREVEIRVNDDYIQWRYVGESAWLPVISLEALEGEDGVDGRETELAVVDGELFWRYVGQEQWTLLADLMELLTVVEPDPEPIVGIIQIEQKLVIPTAGDDILRLVLADRTLDLNANVFLYNSRNQFLEFGDVDVFADLTAGGRVTDVMVNAAGEIVSLRYLSSNTDIRRTSAGIAVGAQVRIPYGETVDYVLSRIGQSPANEQPQSYQIQGRHKVSSTSNWTSWANINSGALGNPARFDEEFRLRVTAEDGSTELYDIVFYTDQQTVLSLIPTYNPAIHPFVEIDGHTIRVETEVTEAELLAVLFTARNPRHQADNTIEVFNSEFEDKNQTFLFTGDKVLVTSDWATPAASRTRLYVIEVVPSNNTVLVSDDKDVMTVGTNVLNFVWNADLNTVIAEVGARTANGKEFTWELLFKGEEIDLTDEIVTGQDINDDDILEQIGNVRIRDIKALGSLALVITAEDGTTTASYTFVERPSRSKAIEFIAELPFGAAFNVNESTKEIELPYALLTADLAGLLVKSDESPLGSLVITNADGNPKSNPRFFTGDKVRVSAADGTVPADVYTVVVNIDIDDTNLWLVENPVVTDIAGLNLSVLPEPARGTNTTLAMLMNDLYLAGRYQTARAYWVNEDSDKVYVTNMNTVLHSHFISTTLPFENDIPNLWIEVTALDGVSVENYQVTLDYDTSTILEVKDDVDYIVSIVGSVITVHAELGINQPVRVRDLVDGLDLGFQTITLQRSSTGGNVGLTTTTALTSSTFYDQATGDVDLQVTVSAQDDRMIAAVDNEAVYTIVIELNTATTPDTVANPAVIEQVVGGFIDAKPEVIIPTGYRATTVNDVLADLDLLENFQTARVVRTSTGAVVSGSTLNQPLSNFIVAGVVDLTVEVSSQEVRLITAVTTVGEFEINLMTKLSDTAVYDVPGQSVYTIGFGGNIEVDFGTTIAQLLGAIDANEAYQRISVVTNEYVARTSGALATGNLLKVVAQDGTIEYHVIEVGPAPAPLPSGDVSLDASKYDLIVSVDGLYIVIIEGTEVAELIAELEDVTARGYTLHNSEFDLKTEDDIFTYDILRVEAANGTVAFYRVIELVKE